MSHRQQAVTISDVARLSGVSPATVSRVLNDGIGFSEDTGRMVLDVVARTGYQANGIARALRVLKSGTVGLVVPDITNYFFSQVVEHVERELFAERYSTIICNTGRDAEKENSYLKKLDSKMVDGLILISGNPSTSQDVEVPNLPIVCVDREIAGSESTTFVSSDHEQGGYLATAELIAKGTRPVVLTTAYESTSSSARIAGYRNALRAHGIPESDARIIRVQAAEGGTNVSAALDDEVSAIVANLYAERTEAPIGVFATNDTLAVNAVNAALQRGIQIPQEFAIVGFDDSLISRVVHPPLSTIHQDVPKLAQVACANLIKLMAGDDLLEKRTRIPVWLESRATT